jgi:outer membrane receptor protein involved in Fe transport
MNRDLGLYAQDSWTFRRLILNGGMRFDQIELFNVINSDAADTVRSTNFGTAAYHQVASAVQGRIIRLGAQMKW